MARYSVTTESVTGLAASTVFVNIAASVASGFKLRRVILGVRAGTGAPTPQQVSVGVCRITARGTVTTFLTPVAFDPNLRASQITAVDTAWSVAPTFTAAPFLAEISFNTQSGADIPFELLEEVVCTSGSVNNGIGLINLGNALPAGHLYTATLEWEE